MKIQQKIVLFIQSVTQVLQINGKVEVEWRLSLSNKIICNVYTFIGMFCQRSPRLYFIKRLLYHFILTDYEKFNKDNLQWKINVTEVLIANHTDIHLTLVLKGQAKTVFSNQMCYKTIYIFLFKGRMSIITLNIIPK